jgi:hypothetical protein
LKVQLANQTYQRINDDHRKPLARYGAPQGRASRAACYSELHHELGHEQARAPLGGEMCQSKQVNWKSKAVFRKHQKLKDTICRNSKNLKVG